MAGKRKTKRKGNQLLFFLGSFEEIVWASEALRRLRTKIDTTLGSFKPFQNICSSSRFHFPQVLDIEKTFETTSWHIRPGVHGS